MKHGEVYMYQNNDGYYRPHIICGTVAIPITSRYQKTVMSNIDLGRINGLTEEHNYAMLGNALQTDKLKNIGVRVGQLTEIQIDFLGQKFQELL